MNNFAQQTVAHFIRNSVQAIYKSMISMYIFLKLKINAMIWH